MTQKALGVTPVDEGFQVQQGRTCNRKKNLKDTTLRLKEAKKRFLASSRLHEIDMESMRALKPRLCFWEPRGRLPEDLSIKIFREVGVETRSHAAQVCNVFNNVIITLRTCSRGV